MFDDYSFKPLIEKTLELLYNNDSKLFNLDDSQQIEKHVGERAIVFRFGLYFQKVLDECGMFSDYNLDCEYNRNGTDPKKLPIIGDRIFPDLILHKRGNNDNNLLVIEFKGWWNRNQKYDEEKIRQLINKNGEFRYHEGYTIIFEKDWKSIRVSPIQSES